MLKGPDNINWNNILNDINYLKVMKNNSRPPKGMYINHDDLVTMATGPNTQGEHLLKSMDREIVSYKRVVSTIL